MADYTAYETLPAVVTASGLAASIAFTAAKHPGLAAAVSVPTSDITISGFTLGARRLGPRRLVPVVRRLTGTVSVTTSFKVVVADRGADNCAVAVENHWCEYNYCNSGSMDNEI